MYAGIVNKSEDIQAVSTDEFFIIVIFFSIRFFKNFYISIIFSKNNYGNEIFFMQKAWKRKKHEF